jgi:hypothetical protein
MVNRNGVALYAAGVTQHSPGSRTRAPWGRQPMFPVLYAAGVTQHSPGSRTRAPWGRQPMFPVLYAAGVTQHSPGSRTRAPWGRQPMFPVLYAAGVTQHSPGSRTRAPWEEEALSLHYPAGVTQRRTPALCNPCGVETLRRFPPPGCAARPWAVLSNACGVKTSGERNFKTGASGWYGALTAQQAIGAVLLLLGSAGLLETGDANGKVSSSIVVATETRP